MTQLSDVSLPSTLAGALAEREFTALTPVQSEVLREDATGRDLLVSAQTGSGKTVAYGLAMAKDLLGAADTLGEAGSPLALVIAPTRELALQVQRELDWLYRPAGGRVVSCVGGMDPRREQRNLAEGAHIVVGTPGRLRDHIERKRLDVGALKVVVLDEADEMLDLGFREDLEFILETTPAERRTLLFSATLPKGIVALAENFQREALRIATRASESGHADIEYRVVRILPKESEHAIVNILRFFDPQTAIIFANTRESVRHLQATLTERGFSAVALSGELSQHERNHALQALRDGRSRICVATDVAARGIDLPRLGLVVHADLPHDPEVLQHRSGRTGRAGRKGISILLVPPARRRRAEMLLAGAGIEANWGGPPTAEEIRALDRQRLLQDPLFTEENGEEEKALGQALLAERPAEEIAVALVRLYRSRLPAPEDVGDPGFAPDARAPRRSRADAPAPRGEFGPSVWFKLDIGRRKNADPKWLLPLICRAGGVGKQDIGAIRIFDGETRFEIRQAAAAEFEAAVRGADVEAAISPSEAPEAGSPPRGGKRRFDKRFSEDGPAREHGRPFAGKRSGERDAPRDFGKSRDFGKKRDFAKSRDSAKDFAGKKKEFGGEAAERRPARKTPARKPYVPKEPNWGDQS